MGLDIDDILRAICFFCISLTISLQIITYFKTRKWEKSREKDQKHIQDLQDEYFKKSEQYQAKMIQTFIDLERENSFLKHRVKKLEDNQSATKLSIKV